MWQKGDVVGRKVVIFRASAACKAQSVLGSRWLREEDGSPL